METFSALLALGAGNSPVTGEFPAQRPVTRIFDVFFHLRLIELSSKQPWGWWFETPSRSSWRHCNVLDVFSGTVLYFIISLHWFRLWLGVDQTKSHYLDQWRRFSDVNVSQDPYRFDLKPHGRHGCQIAVLAGPSCHVDNPKCQGIWHNSNFRFPG